MKVITINIILSLILLFVGQATAFQNPEIGEFAQRDLLPRSAFLSWNQAQYVGNPPRRNVRSVHRNEPNLYGFVRNNPLSFIDPLGLSAADVGNMLSTATRSFYELCDKNCRCDNGALNNLGIVFLGKPWYGCGKQAEYVYLALKKQFPNDSIYKLNIEDGWRPLPHQWVEASPVEAGDPVISIDPHRGQIYVIYNDRIEWYDLTCKPKSITRHVSLSAQPPPPAPN